MPLRSLVATYRKVSQGKSRGAKGPAGVPSQYVDGSSPRHLSDTFIAACGLYDLQHDPTFVPGISALLTPEKVRTLLLAAAAEPKRAGLLLGAVFDLLTAAKAQGEVLEPLKRVTALSPPPERVGPEA